MRSPTEEAADRLEEAALRHALRLRQLAGARPSAEADKVPPEVEASLRELERECLAILNLHEQESSTCRPISVS